MNINALNNYELYGQKIGSQGARSANPFGGSKTQHQPPLQAQSERSLDAQMLSEKKAAFENGLGGTNNPDDHKLFLSA